MIHKHFEAIGKQDIDALVEHSVAEGRTVEYKQELPGRSDEERREFLADVSSFANAGGGDLLYGIVEKRDGDNKPTGIPEKAEGCPGVNGDVEIRRLDEIIRAGIDPRIPNCRIRAIDGFPSGPILLIRVPRSWASPHMVTFKNLSRFFSRTSAGKYQLDVREIHSAFTASANIRTRIGAFRTDRISTILANEGPVRLNHTHRLVVHAVPLSFQDPTFQLDLQQLAGNPDLFSSILSGGRSYRFNLDGFLAFGVPSPGGGCAGYVQVFRSGAVEIVHARDFKSSQPTHVKASAVEQLLLSSAQRLNVAGQQLPLPIPVVLLVTLLGMNGLTLDTGSVWSRMDPDHSIDRDTLMLPDVLLEDFNNAPDGLLRPILDAFWQCAGFASCDHYNNQGRWDGGRSQLPGGPG